MAGEPLRRPLEEPPRPGNRPLAARRTRRIVTNSSGVVDFYARHGLPREKFTVIPNGVLPPKPSPTSRDCLLEELRLPPDARLIGLVGRLWPQKRVDDAIWAADLLKRVHASAHLLILGDGPCATGRAASATSHRPPTACISSVSREDAWRILPHFDVLWSTMPRTKASPTRSWRPCRTQFRSWPPTSPALATWSSMARPACWFRQPRPTRSAGRATFAKHTLKLLEDAQLARRLGEAGRRRMETEFTVERMVARHAELYRELLL